MSRFSRAIGLVLIYSCVWSTAWAEGPAPAPKVLSQKQREQVAIRAVKQALGAWVPRSDQIRVRSAIVPFNGDERNPITGTGPVEIFVRQDPKEGTRRGTIGSFFDKYSNRRFFVNVCGDGKACILAQEYDAPFYKLGRAMRPIRELAGDAFASKEGVGGLIQMGLGAAIHTALGAAGIASGIAFIANSVKGRRDARKQALVDTVSWARDQGKSETGFPHITTAYRHYTQRLEDIKAGTTPLDLKRFAEQLSAQGL